MSPLRVLVVDDEPDFLQMIRVRLESEHYEVITASDGRKALELMKGNPADAVLLDIMMPGMDGLEVLRKIRRLHKNLPVFMLTAFSDEKRFAAARKLNASGFVTKTDWMGEGMKNVTSALRLCPRYQSGFTLIELVLAILLLVGGIASATFVFGRGLYATTDAEWMEQASALAQEKMEQIRGTTFASIASESKATVSGWTGFSREVVVTPSPAGTNSNFKQVVVTVYWDATGGELSTSLTSDVCNVTNG